MAESAISTVLSQLASLAAQEAAFLRGVREQVEWLPRELRRMRAFLKVAASRRGDETVENRVREIRDAAYEMEDIIGRAKYMAERQRQRRGCMGTLSRYCPTPRELITLHKIGSDIVKIKKKIEDITASIGRYNTADLGESGVEEASDWDDHLQALREMPDHFFDDNDVIGFEDDKEKIVKLLVDPENKDRSVISIVGMGGLGKTTLARKVYNFAREVRNDAEQKQHFDTSVWLTISRKYDVQVILKDIVKANIPGVTNEELDGKTEIGLKEKLHNFFQGRRYLVVMDDVWAVGAWDRICPAFPDKNNNGSRILLTTRHIDVARHAGPWIPPHELQLLNETQSLELFRKKAFPPNQGVPAGLDELAEQLAGRCGGLPLALVVLGGLLSRKHGSYDAWSRVAQSLRWESTREGQERLDILSLSYNDLRYQLKPCFLYITAFPEDSVISASRLVRLWIAEGFILQQQGQTMEDTARDWLDELLQRCMIQVVQRTRARGLVKSIRIHDTLRDFGQSEARKDKFLHICSNDDMGIMSDGTWSHRAAFCYSGYCMDALSSAHLRTFLAFDFVHTGRFLKGLNLLRVLDLEGAGCFVDLPKQIGNMIHLRYLGLRRTNLKRLPSSVGHLLNLQTLDVRNAQISWLPKSFWKIRTLRHVYINILMFLSSPIISEQQNLQTLQIAKFVGDIPITGIDMDVIDSTDEMVWRNYGRTSTKSVGKALEKMGGLVSFSLDWSQLSSPAGVIFARAPYLQKLHSLYLEGSFEPQQLPDNTRFPPNLTKLTLISSFLEQDPMPVLEKLPNLRLLKLLLCAYGGRSMSCSAGGFPQLQHLILFALFEEWKVEFGAMRSLTHLTLHQCRGLKMLPEELQHVTALRELKLIRMTHGFNDRVRNEDAHKVQHIPSIIFEEEVRGFEW